MSYKPYMKRDELKLAAGFLEQTASITLLLAAIFLTARDQLLWAAPVYIILLAYLTFIWTLSNDLEKQSRYSMIRHQICLRIIKSPKLMRFIRWLGGKGF